MLPHHIAAHLLLLRRRLLPAPLLPRVVIVKEQTGELTMLFAAGRRPSTRRGSRSGTGGGRRKQARELGATRNEFGVEASRLMLSWVRRGHGPPVEAAGAE
jgi:hypothetical protein